MDWNQLVWFVPPALGGLLIGHAVGMRQSRKVAKLNRQKIDEQALDLLEARAAFIQAQSEPAELERKERLLKLVLTKLQQANKEVRDLQQQRDVLCKAHLRELSYMRARSAEACETARKACEIAINATQRLDRLSQIAREHEPNAGELDETVPISMAERALRYGSIDPKANTINLDSTDHNELSGGKEASAG